MLRESISLRVSGVNRVARETLGPPEWKSQATPAPFPMKDGCNKKAGEMTRRLGNIRSDWFVPGREEASGGPRDTSGLRRLKSVLLDLVQQSAIADIQVDCRASAVPS